MILNAGKKRNPQIKKEFKVGRVVYDKAYGGILWLIIDLGKEEIATLLRSDKHILHTTINRDHEAWRDATLGEEIWFYISTIINRVVVRLSEIKRNIFHNPQKLKDSPK